MEDACVLRNDWNGLGTEMRTKQLKERDESFFAMSFPKTDGQIKSP
jgi:hypothetical protein